MSKNDRTKKLINIFETIRHYYSLRNKVVILGFVLSHNIEFAKESNQYQHSNTKNIHCYI